MVAPALSIVTSPIIATDAATFVALPTNTFPLVSAVPTGEAVIVAEPPKDTAVPFIVNELFDNLSLVTVALAILTPVTDKLASFSVVTFAFKILAVVTASSAILAFVTAKASNLSVVTAALAILAVVTAKPSSLSVVTAAFKILAVVTFDVPIVVAPALSIVTSPLIATDAATFDALPTNTFPLVSAVPTGEAVIVAVPPKDTAVPFIVNELFNNLSFVTLAAASLAVVTFKSAILVVVTASSAILAFVTFEVPIVVTPKLLIVTSPNTETSVATFDALPIYTIPSARVFNAPTFVSTYALVAASCAFVGSATPVSFLLPKATSAAAGPNPLIGILALSNFPSVTLVLAILSVVTFEVPIAVTPALSIVTSPLIATAAATLEALPTNTLPLVSAVPIGEAVIVAVPPKATVFPLIVTELFNNFAFVTLPSAILAVVTAFVPIVKYPELFIVASPETETSVAISFILPTYNFPSASVFKADILPLIVVAILST